MVREETWEGKRLASLFALWVLLLGLAYTVLVPAYAAPDEFQHINLTYAVAGRLMGWQSTDPDHKIVLRQDEYDHGLRWQGIDRLYYAEYLGRLTEKCRDDTKVEADYSNNPEVPKLIYLPAALGVVAGRLLGLGVVATLSLGRLMNLFLFLLAGTASIRLLPDGKGIVPLLAALPMVMQEVCSFSHDSLILSLSLVTVSMVLHLAWEGGKILWPFTVLCCLVLSRCKYGACLPLCFLLLLILRRKETWERVLALGALAASVFLGFLPGFVSTFTSGVLTDGGTVYYTVGEVLGHPWNTFLVLGNTVHRYLDSWILSFLGNSLGWYELTMPTTAVLVPAALLMALAWCRGIPHPGRTELAGWERAVLLLSCLCGAAFAVGGMMIGHTPAGSPVIEGVQGRYLLPFALPFFFGISSSALVGEVSYEKLERGLVYVGVAASVVEAGLLVVRA